MSSTHAKPKADQRLDAVFRALADGTRRRIVIRLARGPSSVSEVAEPFLISLAAVSKHLDVLERAGLVRRVREGRYQRCQLIPRPLEDASVFLDRYRSFWTDALDDLARYVEDAPADEPKPRQKGTRR